MWAPKVPDGLPHDEPGNVLDKDQIVVGTYHRKAGEEYAGNVLAFTEIGPS